MKADSLTHRALSACCPRAIIMVKGSEWACLTGAVIEQGFPGWRLQPRSATGVHGSYSNPVLTGSRTEHTHRGRITTVVKITIGTRRKTRLDVAAHATVSVVPNVHGSSHLALGHPVIIVVKSPGVHGAQNRLWEAGTPWFRRCPVRRVVARDTLVAASPSWS